MTNNNNKNKKLMLCIPAIIYLVFGVISIIMSIVKKQSVLSIFISVIFIALWTFLLNVLVVLAVSVLTLIILTYAVDACIIDVFKDTVFMLIELRVLILNVELIVK